MTITFDEIVSTSDTAAAVSARALRSYGFTDPAIVSGGAFGFHRRRLRSFGVAEAGATSIPDPEIPVLAITPRFLRSGALPTSSTFYEASHTRRLGSLGFSGEPGTVGCVHRRKFRSYALAGLGDAGHAILVAQPFFLSSFAGAYFEQLDEEITAAPISSNVPIYGVFESFTMSGTTDDTLTGLCVVQDRIEFDDALRLVFRELLTEGFTMGGDVQANYQAVERLLDAITFAGLASNALEAGNILTAAIAFSELLTSGFVVEVTDSVAFGVAVNDALRAAASLLESILMEAVPTAAARFTAVVQESLLIDDEAINALSAVELLQEGVSFAIHLNIDDGNYVAYSINTENRQVTEYTNFPFNSFARMPAMGGGWDYYGMAPDGIRRLEGTDDAGSPIAARFRLALTNMGTGQFKRMQAAYLGYTSTGELRIKAIIVAVDGKKEAHYYRLHSQPAAAPQQSRIKIGEGLRAVYWGFEVESIDGAAFMIDLLDLHPLSMPHVGRMQGEGGSSR